jgi:3',5'-cyclic AMP phosphodiesterase CpdA
MFPFQKDCHKERENLGLAIEAINRLRPDFVVICGDLVNDRHDHKQLEAFRQTIAKLDKGILLYLVPGNHELGNRPTPETIEQYRKDFGPDYYSFTRHGWTFVVLNSSLMKGPSKALNDAEEQLRWLTATLDSASEKKTNIAVFQHHPWFIWNVIESNGYFNMPRKVRTQYLNLMVSHGVSYVFAGHLHDNASGEFKTLSMITSGPVGMPLGTSPSGLRIVIIRGSSVEHRYYGLKEVPQSVELGGTANPVAR